MTFEFIEIKLKEYIGYTKLYKSYIFHFLLP